MFREKVNLRVIAILLLLRVFYRPGWYAGSFQGYPSHEKKGTVKFRTKEERCMAKEFINNLLALNKAWYIPPFNDHSNPQSQILTRHKPFSSSLKKRIENNNCFKVLSLILPLMFYRGVSHRFL